ncbi:hypothetical protein [Amycolatopsis sp. CA-230715]|uniref:hypothetical protein n=1 Tax=Amycolatopsis sp. CA-230715 TaxID=2745196 RepID=UPI001C011E91|nr:hypothetical protein [Amycolatopsis sp. CA-230715]QWF82900.1 hypothetical protein HUW46_06339 [Amycolatopsis sp. CA-230715]
MTPDDLFDAIADELASTGVTTGAMFGKRSLHAHGKAVACLKDHELAFRLGRDTPAHHDALQLPGAHLFDPSGKGRPFKDWVAVPDAHAAAWPELAETARDTA